MSLAEFEDHCGAGDRLAAATETTTSAVLVNQNEREYTETTGRLLSGNQSLSWRWYIVAFMSTSWGPGAVCQPPAITASRNYWSRMVQLSASAVWTGRLSTPCLRKKNCASVNFFE